MTGPLGASWATISSAAINPVKMHFLKDVYGYAHQYYHQQQLEIL